MPKFRKKPIVIEAVQWDGTDVALDTIERWAGSAPGPDDCGVSVWNGDLFVGTLEGEMRANPKDWIIRGVKGELYPCKPDIFAETYEQVES
jgi:hypothetical protein